MNTITMRLNAVTQVVAPVTTVLHLTDPSTGTRPVVLGKSQWFTDEEAVEFAAEESAKYPNPQRFAVFDEHSVLVAILQCGKRVPIFEVVGA